MSDDTLQIVECDGCGYEHDPDNTPCPTVECCDCGCEHQGEVDECECVSGYCEECECDESCVNKPEDGCAACWWHYDQTGHSDTCSYGDTDEPNEECYYYGDYMASVEGPAPADPHFSVRNLPAVEPHELTGTSEFSVAAQLGLDPHLNLSTACADFYVLERLFYNSHDLVQRNEKLVPGLPMDFGRDTRAERAALAIARTRESLNRQLARQLLTYIIMAVGGELRHATTNARKVVQRRGTPKKDWPTLEHDTWREFPYLVNAYEDTPMVRKANDLTSFGCAACVSWVRYVKKVEKEKAKAKHPHPWQVLDSRSVMPCRRRVAILNPSKSGYVMKLRPAKEANPDCGYFDWWCKENNIVRGGEHVTPYRPHNDRMRQFFNERMEDRMERKRGLAWREWLKLYTEHGPVVLQDCADVFNKWKWVPSFGGEKWGQAAQFAFEYAAGRMSSSAFLDRVWTLEHNGGCLFNKFYRRGQNTLRMTLDRQAKDEQHYPKLIKSASRYTQELYAEAENLGILHRTPTIVWG